ncbi:MAG: zf-TFIIB domain-containing protein [Thiomonas sp.]|nr:zf-TFIIB domain-containing protein [Thiomonas sp.]
MQCPHCAGTTLVMAERQGIEIDYCPKCRGVWLDRGELDKIVERAAAAERSAAHAAPAPATTPAPQRAAPRQPDFEDSDFRRPSHDSRQGQQPYRKRKSLLSDLFDFD